MSVILICVQQTSAVARTKLQHVCVSLGVLSRKNVEQGAQAAVRHHDELLRKAKEKLGVDLSEYEMLGIGACQFHLNAL